MKISTKRVRLVEWTTRLLLCVVSLSVSVDATRAADAKLAVIVPDGDNLQFMSFWVAKGAGYFAEEGIDLRLLVPDEPNQAKRMVLAGEADCAVLPPPMYLELIAADFPWVLVANLLANDAINLVVRRSVMVERKLSAAAPLKDRLSGLAGLRIGVAPNPPTRLRALYAAAGLDADRDLQMVILRGREQNEAFADGRVDALYAHTPYLEKALVDQDAVMLVNQSGGDAPTLAVRQIHALAVSRQLAAQDPQVVLSLTRAIVHAQQLIHSDRPATVAAISREFPKMPRPHIEAIVEIYAPAVPQTPRVAAAGFQAALDLFPASRKAPDLAGLDLTKFVATEFVDRALASLDQKRAE